MSISAIRIALRSVDSHTHRGRALHVLTDAVENGVGATPPEVPQATIDEVLSKLSTSSERDDVVLRGIATAATTRDGSAVAALNSPDVGIIGDTVLRDLANEAAALTPA